MTALTLHNSFLQNLMEEQNVTLAILRFHQNLLQKKTGIDPTKATSKRVVQKTAEATADLIGNKIADKITSIGKPKEKEKTKEIEEIYIPPEKRQQIIDDLRLFWAQNMTPLYKSGISKNYEFSRHSLWW